jgi:flagellin
MLQRMRQLVVQASNDTLEPTDRNKIVLELNQLSSEISSTADRTEFNKKKLIDGSWSNNAIWVQAGANKEQGLSINIDAMSAEILGVAKADIGDRIENPTSNKVDAVFGSTNIFNGSSTLSLNFNDLDNVQAWNDAVGIYDFGGGRTMEIRGNLAGDREIILDGFTNATTNRTWTIDEILAEAHDFALFNDPGAGELKFNNPATGVLELQFDNSNVTAAGKGYVENTTAVVAGTASAQTTQFGNGNMLLAVSDGKGNANSITFKIQGEADVYDQNGKRIDIDKNKAYTHAEFTELFSGGIVVMNGNRSTIGADGTSTPDAPGVYGVQINPTTGFSSGEEISRLVDKMDAALETVATQRANLGAYQNRLEHTIKNLDVSAENLAASESRIRDTDMAKEMMELTKNNVLAQAATAMLAQANQGPQNLLQLLR